VLVLKLSRQEQEMLLELMVLAVERLWVKVQILVL
jgi:hypothetical protein